MTASQQARYMRAEIEAIAASLRVPELAQLLALGRCLLEAQDVPTEISDACYGPAQGYRPSVDAGLKPDGPLGVSTLVGYSSSIPSAES